MKKRVGNCHDICFLIAGMLAQPELMRCTVFHLCRKQLHLAATSTYVTTIYIHSPISKRVCRGFYKQHWIKAYIPDMQNVCANHTDSIYCTRDASWQLANTLLCPRKMNTLLAQYTVVLEMLYSNWQTRCFATTMQGWRRVQKRGRGNSTREGRYAAVSGLRGSAAGIR